MEQLIQAIRQGDLDSIKAILQAQPDLINKRGVGGFTPLILVAYLGNTQITNYLLEQGADINGRDVAGNTALIGVAFKGDPEMAQLLLGKGADINLKNEQGATALSYAIEHHHTDLDLIQLLKEAGT